MASPGRRGVNKILVNVIKTVVMREGLVVGAKPIFETYPHFYFENFFNDEDSECHIGINGFKYTITKEFYSPTKGVYAK